MNNCNEIWKDIQGYEGIYQVSSLGRIKKIMKRYYDINTKNITNKKVEKIMAIGTHYLGYKNVKLTNQNGKRSNLFLHRIIAQAFIPNVNNYQEINHINGIKDDNRIENLEWCNRKQNIRHAWDNKFCEKTRLSSKINGKKCEVKRVQLDMNNNVLKIWDSATEVEKELGIKHTNICACCTGKAKTAGGYKWRYANEHYWENGSRKVYESLEV